MAEKDRVLMVSSAQLQNQGWRLLDASDPLGVLESREISDIVPATIEELTTADVPHDANWSLRKPVKVLVQDTWDAWWAWDFVVEMHAYARNKQSVKRELAVNLWEHLLLLSSLESPKMAPVLKKNLAYLRRIFSTREDQAEPGQGS